MPLSRLPKEPADRLTMPFLRFIRIEATAGSVLLLSALVALVISNSQWSADYEALWNVRIGLLWGGVEFARPVRQWINDGAMTLFFFVVALELTRELLLGELRDSRKALLSVAAAAGGMSVPVLLFLAVAHGGQGAHAWGVVTATDTAFVIGCLALLGSRIPHGLRLFLLSLAIFDDIGAITIIALAYGKQIDWAAIACALAGLGGVVLLRMLGVRALLVFFAAGIGIWLAVDASGIHPTLTGVVLGAMTPTRSWVSDRRLQAILGVVAAYPEGPHWSGDTRDRADLQRAGVATREALSPLERLEVALHPWVGLLVLPLFALANAGFVISAQQVDWTLSGAILLGLLCGKPMGVVLFSYAAVRLRLAVLPQGLTWPLVAGGALLTGIGFTMSVLMAELALAPDHVASAKLGILVASGLAALGGVSVLAVVGRKRPGRAGARTKQAEA